MPPFPRSLTDSIEKFAMERDPAAVLQAAIRGVVDRLPESVKEEKPDVVTFQPARYFIGRKEGFYFGTGNNGTGQVLLRHLA